MRYNTRVGLKVLHFKNSCLKDLPIGPPGFLQWLPTLRSRGLLSGLNSLFVADLQGKQIFLLFVTAAFPSYLRPVSTKKMIQMNKFNSKSILYRNTNEKIAILADCYPHFQGRIEKKWVVELECIVVRLDSMFRIVASTILDHRQQVRVVLP